VPQLAVVHEPLNVHETPEHHVVAGHGTLLAPPAQ